MTEHEHEPTFKQGDRVVLPGGAIGVIADVFLGPMSRRTVYVVGDYGFYSGELLAYAPASDESAEARA